MQEIVKTIDPTNDKIEENTVADLEKMLQRKKIEELHRYKIFYSKKRNAWYTCHPLDYTKRIQRKSKEALIDALEPFLHPEIGKSLTITDIFPEWLQYKTLVTNSPNTISKHEQHWNRYFAGNKLFLQPISDITEWDLNIWANNLIKQYNLTSKQWQTVKIIPKQIFEYAYSKNYIKDNIFPKIKVTVKFRQTVKKTGATQIFTNDEYNDLIEDLWKSFEKKKTKNYLAVLLNFLLGLRVGELTALKWENIYEDYIHICREIVCIENSNKLNIPYYQQQFKSGEMEILPGQQNKKCPYVLVDHTKTYSDRRVPLIPQAQKILSILQDLSPEHQPHDFIFEQNGKILTIRGVNSVLEYACKHIGIPVKRSHKIRKTVASRLNAAQLPLDGVRELLGHQSLATTMGYIYDPQTPKERFKTMEKALQI